MRSVTFGNETEEEFERKISTIEANEVVKEFVEGVRVGELGGSSQVSEEI